MVYGSKNIKVGLLNQHTWLGHHGLSTSFTQWKLSPRRSGIHRQMQTRRNETCVVIIWKSFEIVNTSGIFGCQTMLWWEVLHGHSSYRTEERKKNHHSWSILSKLNWPNFQDVTWFRGSHRHNVCGFPSQMWSRSAWSAGLEGPILSTHSSFKIQV